MENNMDLNEMRKIVEQANKEQEAKRVAEEHTKTEVSDTVNTSDTITNNETINNQVPVELYSGPGLVVNKEKPKEDELDNLGVVSPLSMNHIDSYMNDLDEDIKTITEENEKIKDNISNEEVYTAPTKTEEEFNNKYNAASEIIIKTGVGTVVDFTPEERAKLERAKTIRLEEVETREIKTLKTKRLKKVSDLNKIIKRNNDSRTSHVVLPLSGYTATMKGCSAYELMSLIDTKGNAMIDTQNKWSIVHSKIDSTSIGKMDFDTFLHNTAAADYNNLIFGILCATYPDDDKLPVTCPNDKCKNSYDHAYSMRSLIRAESMSERLRDTFMKIADASISVEDARQCHEEALINITKSIVLPVSEYIMEIYVQTAHDLINRSIKALGDDKDNKYAEAAILSTMINRVIIPDLDDPDCPYEIDSTMEIGEIIYNLSDIDLNILRTVADDLFGDMAVEFGLMAVKCPNCGHFTPTIPMDLDNLLFHKYRQAMNMTIE